MEIEHEASAHHVAKLAIGLTPVPGLTEELRERSATRFGVASDELAYELEIGVGDLPATVLHFHGREGSGEGSGTQA